MLADTDSAMTETLSRTVALAPDYEIPRIILGAWQLSEGHNVERPNKDDVLDAFTKMADAGLTTFDCADIYTGVEELLGEFLRARRSGGVSGQSPIRIHTKFVPDRDALPKITKRYTEAIIDRSLRRLGVERLDLVQFGWWDYEVPGYVETATWLHDLAREGKIAHIGLTNFDTIRLGEIMDAGVRVVSHQVQYSLLDRRPAGDLADLCRTHGIHLLCYGTLAGGFMSARWLGVGDPGMDLPNRSLTKYKLIIDEGGGWTAFQQLLCSLQEIATKHDVGIGNVATRYVLDRPRVAAAIVGARDDTHLQDNLRTLELELEHEDSSRLAEMASRHRLAGDVYELERQPESVHAAIMRYNLNREASDN